jgi:hypothetical protein
VSDFVKEKKALKPEINIFTVNSEPISSISE